MPHRLVLTLLLGLPCAALGQQRLPFAFDPSLARNPASVQTKTGNLDRALPAAFRLPSAFGTLSSAPDGVTTCGNTIGPLK